MTGIAPAPQPRDLDAEEQRDIERFEEAIGQYLNGDIEEDVFRVMRLNNGIYGQRQGGTNQMVRIKVPAGTITPEQLDLMSDLANEFSRGWGHITTRQNIQFHFVELRRIPELLRRLAAVGLTTREACGDTVRNVMACHLAGACPHEHLDVTPWAEATFRHFVRNPLGQRLPRKFKVNFSGCSTDCGQAMFNDVGVVATTRDPPPTAPPNRVSGCTSPVVLGPTRTPPSPLRTSPPARICCPLSRRVCECSNRPATGTTNCGPA